jgi:hypothetical protein
MRQHYTPAPVPRPWADVLLAISIGLILASILLEYL